MAEQAQVPSSPAGGSRHHDDVDWKAAAESPEFRELVERRRSFTVPVLGFVFVWYFGFIALAGYAQDFMGERLVGGLTVGYAIALSQFVMTWVLGWLYLRKSDREFDPLARAAAEQALNARGPSSNPGPTGDGPTATGEVRS